MLKDDNVSRKHWLVFLVYETVLCSDVSNAIVTFIWSIERICPGMMFITCDVQLFQRIRKGFEIITASENGKKLQNVSTYQPLDLVFKSRTGTSYTKLFTCHNLACFTSLIACKAQFACLLT
jgi:hypothetical protein